MHKRRLEAISGMQPQVWVAPLNTERVKQGTAQGDMNDSQVTGNIGVIHLMWLAVAASNEVLDKQK